MSRSFVFGALFSLALTAVAAPSQAQRWQYRRCRREAWQTAQQCQAQCPPSRRDPDAPSGRCLRMCEEQRQEAEAACQQNSGY